MELDSSIKYILEVHKYVPKHEIPEEFRLTDEDLYLIPRILGVYTPTQEEEEAELEFIQYLESIGTQNKTISYQESKNISESEEEKKKAKPFLDSPAPFWGPGEFPYYFPLLLKVNKAARHAVSLIVTKISEKVQNNTTEIKNEEKPYLAVSGQFKKNNVFGQITKAILKIVTQVISDINTIVFNFSQYLLVKLSLFKQTTKTKLSKLTAPLQLNFEIEAFKLIQQHLTVAYSFFKKSVYNSYINVYKKHYLSKTVPASTYISLVLDKIERARKKPRIKPDVWKQLRQRFKHRPVLFQNYYSIKHYYLPKFTTLQLKTHALVAYYTQVNLRFNLLAYSSTIFTFNVSQYALINYNILFENFITFCNKINITYYNKLFQAISSKHTLSFLNNLSSSFLELKRKL